ncbi:MAG: tetratricopeptide repeat protein [Candidatus Nitrosotenuis sp.]|nr:MAG: tetratricopeptide repeat protein [Candidatus Nitrosotenuis sp.]
MTKKSPNSKKDAVYAKDESAYKNDDKKELVRLLSSGSRFYDDGKYPEAISEFDKALAIAPDDPIALSNKAGALIEMSQYEKAVPLLDKALTVDPLMASALYNKAAYLSLMGEINESLSYLERAIKINPDMAKLAKNDKDFLYVRNLPGFSVIVD